MSTDQTNVNFYVVILSYQVPLERLKETIPAHREFLSGYYHSEQVLFSGMQLDQSGGVIIMRARSEAEVQSMIEGDPFFQKELATYQIVSFDCRRHQPFLDSWIQGKSF